MKKFLFVFFTLIIGFPVLSQENFELKKDCEYLYFSDSKVIGIKSNNPSVISAQRVSTYTGEENQIMFYPKKVGIADIQIQTEKGIKTYNIIIKNGQVKQNSIFVELDIPGITE